MGNAKGMQMQVGTENHEHEREKYARDGGEVRDCVVDGDAGGERDACRRDPRIASIRPFSLQNESSWRTSGDLDTLDRLRVDGGSGLFEQFVALHAEIDHFGAFNRELDELFGNIVDNLSRGLLISVGDVSDRQFEVFGQVKAGIDRRGVTMKKDGICVTDRTLYLVRSASAIPLVLASAAGAEVVGLSASVIWGKGRECTVKGEEDKTWAWDHNCNFDRTSVAFSSSISAAFFQ